MFEILQNLNDQQFTVSACSKYISIGVNGQNVYVYTYSETCIKRTPY